MIREIVLDTETTGIDPAQGHRIVEIGAVELINHMPTGKAFHVYLNPQRDMPKEAEAVHGLSAKFLSDKPLFEKEAQNFLDFIADSTLVIHNAKFDMGFINAELAYINKRAIPMDSVIDTLMLARKTHPMGPNSLDALCKRFGIDNSKRTKHGALLDAELLADVYLELIGGKQTSLGLAAISKKQVFQSENNIAVLKQRQKLLPPRLSANEITAHNEAVIKLGKDALWTN